MHPMRSSLFRIVKDILIPWYSFRNLLAANSIDLDNSASCFAGRILSSLSDFDIDPRDYSGTALVYGSGPSLSEHKNALLDSIGSDGDDLRPPFLRVALNSTVYSGLPCDVAFFETPVIPEFIEVNSDMVDAGYHLPGFKDRKVKFFFTNYSADAFADYFHSPSFKDSLIVPQFNIYLPKFRSSLTDFSLISAFKVSRIFSGFGIIRGAIFMRSSLIRCVVILGLLGFKEVRLIGFDGGNSYFYDDRHAWPHLHQLREVAKEVHSRDEIVYVKNGVKVVTKSHSPEFHTTQNPSISEYTNDVLLPLLSKLFGIKICRY